MRKQITCLAMGFLATSSFGQSYVEGFENIGGTTTNGQTGGAILESAGWFFQNNSISRGIQDWFQGYIPTFGPHSGAGYIACNYNSGAGYANLSNWMLTPPRQMRNGSTVTFWTRTIANPAFPDRLEVRWSSNGASTNVGSTPVSVGDFTLLLGDVNPGLTQTGYPSTWTQYTFTYTGPTVVGRIGFRYFVKGGGPFGFNSNYIGIDDLSVLF